MLDGAVACFDGVAGVEPQSETVWRQADKYGVPRMCFINKLDRTGANFKYCVQSIIDRLGAKPAVLYIPIGLEADLKGLVDLVENRAIIWKDESLGAEFFYEDIPADLADEAALYRSELIELVIDQDDDAMEAYLEGTEPDAVTLKALIRKGTLNHSFVPVVCGSAFKNKGRPAAARCGGRLPAFAARHRRRPGRQDGQRREGQPPAQGRRAVQRLGVQGDERSVRRLAHLHPYLFGHVGQGHLSQFGQGPEGEGRPHPRDARQRPQGTSTRRSRATSSRSPA